MTTQNVFTLKTVGGSDTAMQPVPAEGCHTTQPVTSLTAWRVFGGPARANRRLRATWTLGNVGLSMRWTPPDQATPDEAA